MMGQGSDGCSAAAIALSVKGAVLVARVGSRMNLLRCPARINLSIKNLGLGNDLFHSRGPCGSVTS